MSKTRTPFRGRSAWVALPSLMALALSAQAQQKPKASTAPEDDTLSEVVVTGSRIARPELDRLEPTVTLDSKALDTKGYLDIGAALNDIPGFGVSPVSSNNTQSAFGIAQSFVDLYSLGSQRTLVLVNGRRFVSGNTASLNGPAQPGEQVDLNTIPTKLIDHIETVSIGGAPVYGSDAIAGTVNIILKKDFQGLDVDAQVGASNHTDAWNYRARVLGGINLFDGRMNVTSNAEYLKTDGLNGLSRPSYSQDLGFLAPATPGPYKTVLTPANSVPAVNFGGIPLVDDAFFAPLIFGVPNSTVGVTNGSGQVLAWGKTGQLQPYDVGTPTGNPIFNSGGDGLRLSQVSNLLSPTERMNWDTLINVEVTDHIKAFGEAWFSETHATNLVAQPAYNTGLFGAAGTPNGTFKLDINNPYLSANDRTSIQNALNAYGAAQPFGGFLDPDWNNHTFYVSRANLDLQSGRATSTQVLARGVAGLQGDFSLGSRSFNWDVAMNYGRVDSNSVVPSYVWNNLQNALNATTDANGKIVCGGNLPAVTSTVSSQCAPLNIFGQGSPSAAAVQYITHLAEAKSLNTQRDFTANFGGDILTLFGNTWKANVGFENRRESAKFAPDEFYTQSLGQVAVTAVSGAYKNNETYGELSLPIVSPKNDIPGLYSVELQGAVRHVINSLSGGATTYTEGLIYKPVNDVTFRANKTKSIRAPAVTELFLPTANVFSFANDPCDKNFVNQGNVPSTRAANCAAAGINTQTFVSNVVNASALGTTSGNPDLAPETANSKTFGIVLQPRWVPRLSFSLDYIYIRLTSAISSLALTDVLNACYDSSAYPTDPVCHAFTRNAAGQITDFHVGYVNAGLLEFGGFTSQLHYALDLPGNYGGFGLGVNWFDMQQLNQKIGSASEVSLAGTLSANSGLQATPRHKGNIDVEYHVWKMGLDIQGLFTGAVKFSNADQPNTKDIEVVHPWWVINSTLQYQPIDKLTVRFIADNVFNKQPPYPGVAGVQANFAAATSLYFSGILGRSYLLGADYKF